MTTEEKEEMIAAINQVLKEYFNRHPEVNEIVAKEMMPIFMENGIFNNNPSDGLPIRKLLRELDEDDELYRIPYVYPERKEKNTYWYFCRL